MNALADLSQSRDLLVNLTLRELRGKYKRSVLGWTWSLLNPLATMVIFSLVFGRLLKIKPAVGDPSGLVNYPAFLLCGLLAWNFLSNAMNNSMVALLGNAGLIKKVYFPRQVLIFATILSLDWSFVIEMGLLVVFLLVLGNMVLPWLLGVVLAMVVLTVFATGIGLDPVDAQRVLPRPAVPRRASACSCGSTPRRSSTRSRWCPRTSGSGTRSTPWSASWRSSGPCSTT